MEINTKLKTRNTVAFEDLKVGELFKFKNDGRICMKIFVCNLFGKGTFYICLGTGIVGTVSIGAEVIRAKQIGALLVEVEER